MARRKPAVMIVVVTKATDWQDPDDGRRIFDGTERIRIAEPAPSPAVHLPPWLMTEPAGGMRSRPKRSPGSAGHRGGSLSSARWAVEFAEARQPGGRAEEVGASRGAYGSVEARREVL